MSLKSLTQSPKSVPVALALLVVGLLMNTCTVEWRPLFTPLLHLAPDLDDFAHGLCIGLGLSFEISALVVLVLHLKAREKLL
jgi:hypothetical protein